MKKFFCEGDRRFGPGLYFLTEYGIKDRKRKTKAGTEMEIQTRELTVELLERELQRERDKKQRARRRRRGLLVILIVVVLAGLIGVLAFPILRISGDSMAGTLRDGDVAVGLRLPHYERGTVIGFRYEEGVLVKRLIAQGGDWVELDPDGYVFVNGARLHEPYVSELTRGSGDTAFPLTVPAEKCFVLGDNRPLSVDSRSTALGCIGEEEILGRLLWRVWPLSRFGPIR